MSDGDSSEGVSPFRERERERITQGMLADAKVRHRQQNMNRVEEPRELGHGQAGGHGLWRRRAASGGHEVGAPIDKIIAGEHYDETKVPELAACIDKDKAVHEELLKWLAGPFPGLPEGQGKGEGKGEGGLSDHVWCHPCCQGLSRASTRSSAWGMTDGRWVSTLC